MDLITKAPKGTNDLLYPQSSEWQLMENVFKSEAELNGFSEVRTPVFEHTELFLRGVGDTTDVVEKQMYTFDDKGGRTITLRPEGTAGAARAMLESGIYNKGYPVKMYYLTACYRYEKPQKGRLREFHQFGVEVFGAEDPVSDAQVISMAKSAFNRLGLKNISLEINSIGCPECRKKYQEVLKEYFTGYKDQLCDTCLSRLDRNTMRILDCKSPVCSEIVKDAPKITAYICDDCKEHFEGVQKYLDILGIEYTINQMIVRGLDYYTRTVFEFISNEIGSQGAIGGGGRYDGLIEQLGGNPVSGLGFGLGLERIMILMKTQGIEFPEAVQCEVYLAVLDNKAREKAVVLVNELHKSGVKAETDICGRGLKAQMKYADRIGAKYSIVLGEEEIKTGKANLKNMKNGETSEISIDDDFIHDYISKS